MLGFDCLMLGLLVILRGTHKPITLWLVGYTQLRAFTSRYMSPWSSHTRSGSEGYSASGA